MRRQSLFVFNGFFRISWRRPDHDVKLFQVLCVPPCRGKFTCLPEPRDFEVILTPVCRARSCQLVLTYGLADGHFTTDRAVRLQQLIGKDVCSFHDFR